MNAVQVQQSVERFSGELLEALVEALQPLSRAESAEARREALRRIVAYSASTLDIAAGPLPEVNVLDMVVFVVLSRRTVERHWVPNLFGDAGLPLLRAFVDAEDRVWHLASRILTANQVRQLGSLIDAWERVNPNRVRVEAVRFEEFSGRAGKVAEELQSNARGLLASVHGATQAADQALLLAERAMFLSHRFPFLVRLQARLGAQEVLSDALSELKTLESLTSRVSESGELLQQVVHLVEESRILALETRQTLDSLKPLLAQLPAQKDLQVTLAASNELADKGLSLLRGVESLAPDDPVRTIASIEARAHHLLQRAVLYVGLLGATWICLFWGGRYVVQRRRTG